MIEVITAFVLYSTKRFIKTSFTKFSWSRTSYVRTSYVESCKYPGKTSPNKQVLAALKKQ